MPYLVNVPFAGFYESIHDAAGTDAVMSATQGENGEALNERLTERLMTMGVEWREWQLKYVQRFTQLLSDQLEVPLKYESMESPRFYNFETDRIFAHIEEEDLLKLHDRVDEGILRDVLRRRFTSYDGFISHYSPYLNDWPEDVREWDHNQIGSLLVALIEEEEIEELYVMEDAQCNGDLDNWVWECANELGERLLKVYNWMRERQDKLQQSTVNSHGGAGSAPAAY